MASNQQPIAPTEAYVITPIPARKRAIQAGILALLGLAMIGRLAYVGYQQGDAGITVVGLIVMVPLFVWALKIWNRTETKSPMGAYVAIPLGTRLLRASPYAAITVTALALVWYDHGSSPLEFLLLITILPGAFAVRELASTKQFVLSNAAVQAKAQEKVENEQKRVRAQLQDEALLRKWWVRYLMASGMFAVAGYFGSRGDPILWGLSALFAIGAAIYAKELVLVVVGVGVLVAAFYGVAALPVSVAVVLGAGIISHAIYKHEKAK